MSNRIAPKLLAEFIGTFSFVFIGAGAAAVVGDGVGLPGIVAIALAHGLAIMSFAFAYGSVATSSASSLAASPARYCCGPFWAVPPRALARLHSRTTSLSAPSPSLSRRKQVS